jgi:methylated-DNA-[protein]-cysteine S-methyltransferase
MRELVFESERVPSPTGLLLVVTDTAGRLRALDWADRQARMRRLLDLQYGCNARLAKTARPTAARMALERYFMGATHAIDDVPVALGGTAFQRCVWTALRRIRSGRTVSYGELARRLGCPRAARAVGAANGANPICIVVPCHRVIGANGALNGYGGGIERKQWLLEHEGLSLSADRTRISA